MHQRVNDCGCIEAWREFRDPGCDDPRYVYELWISQECKTHWDGHTLNMWQIMDMCDGS